MFASIAKLNGSADGSIWLWNTTSLALAPRSPGMVSGALAPEMLVEAVAAAASCPPSVADRSSWVQGLWLCSVPRRAAAEEGLGGVPGRRGAGQQSSAPQPGSQQVSGHLLQRVLRVCHTFKCLLPVQFEEQASAAVRRQARADQLRLQKRL